jgi:hypothetical protein
MSIAPPSTGWDDPLFAKHCALLALPSGGADDEQFLMWERAWEECQAAPSEDDRRRGWDVQLALEKLIFETPSVSLVAARTKLRTLLRAKDALIEAEFLTALEHVLATLATLESELDPLRTTFL